MKEKTEKIVLIGLLAVISIALIFTLTNFFSGSKNLSSSLNNPANIYGIKTSESEVSIDLTPREFRNGKFYVDINFNTHSVDLSQFELKKLITLEFEGKSINPSSAPSIAGHHSGGTLVFDTGKEINKFTIVVRGIPLIEERIFEWP